MALHLEPSPQVVPYYADAVTPKPPRLTLAGGTAQYAFLTPDRATVLAACVTAAGQAAMTPEVVADRAWAMYQRLLNRAAGGVE